MKSFKLIVEFKDVPDELSMEDAKAIASEMVLNINSEDAEDEMDYIFLVDDIKKEFEH